ncbi:unnamed protein product, partial [Vitis vinifera]|uniref:Uncharacterized protein n=1 Tax=Vitis vinifera TaxID=29760 RepID=D7U1L6_VITVI
MIMLCFQAFLHLANMKKLTQDALLTHQPPKLEPIKSKKLQWRNECKVVHVPITISFYHKKYVCRRTFYSP